MKKIITLYLFILSLQLQAQTFTNYTTADGLINNSVHCLAVDGNDDVWFGTQEGLSFFDGETWTNYDVNSHPDLVHNTITALAVDSEGNLWIGTDFGVNKFDGVNWTTYTEADGLADNRIKYINQSADGNIWFANNDGISIFDGTNWTSYVMADGIPFGGTNFVTFDVNGNAWLGTPLAGVLIFDGTDFTSISETDGLLSDKIRSIAIDADNEKWIGTADGISLFNANNAFVTHHEFIFQLPPPDKLNPIEDIQIDSKGRPWVGIYVDYLLTEGGISLYGNSTWMDYDVDDGLVGPVVRRLDIDSNDIVWVVTSTGITKIGDLPNATFDIQINNAIEVYPNPTHTRLTLEIPNDLIGSTYQIYNNVGQLTTEGRLLQTELTLGLEMLTNGIYFLSIDGVYTKKIVIKK